MIADLPMLPGIRQANNCLVSRVVNKTLMVTIEERSLDEQSETRPGSRVETPTLLTSSRSLESQVDATMSAIYHGVSKNNS